MTALRSTHRGAVRRRTMPVYSGPQARPLHGRPKRAAGKQGLSCNGRIPSDADSFRIAATRIATNGRRLERTARRLRSAVTLDDGRWLQHICCTKEELYGGRCNGAGTADCLWPGSRGTRVRWRSARDPLLRIGRARIAARLRAWRMGRRWVAKKGGASRRWPPSSRPCWPYTMPMPFRGGCEVATRSWVIAGRSIVLAEGDVAAVMAAVQAARTGVFA